mgnify:FL=1
MSARRLLLPLGLLVCLAVSVWCTRFLFTAHLNNPSEVISSLVDLPERAIGLVSLEFDGVLSDYLMLKTMVFLGEKMERGERPSDREWHLVLRSLQQTTNLDDRFWDPYVLAAMTFPWEVGMIPETCALLEKAALARPEDHRPYFFLWFMKYYFEKDTRGAARYIKLASEKPGAPEYYATLAARMDLYAGNTLTGALFLEDILAKTSSPTTRQFLEKRIDALKRIAFLEEKVGDYKQRFGQLPTRLEELVQRRVILAIPADPYGGEFFLQRDGRVYTTSKLVEMKKVDAGKTGKAAGGIPEAPQPEGP